MPLIHEFKFSFIGEKYNSHQLMECYAFNYNLCDKAGFVN